jgi:hypothetical protein
MIYINIPLTLAILSNIWGIFKIGKSLYYNYTHP